MSPERRIGHKLAMGLGSLALIALWYGLFAVGDEPIYKLEQAVGLLGGALAFGMALAFARGRREELRVGWAYLGTVVATMVLHASALTVFGAGPNSATVGASFGSGLAYGLPYLLVAYGWKGAEVEGDDDATVQSQSP